MLNYEDNPDYMKIPRPEVGDAVILYAEKSWHYKVRVIVHGTEDDNITGHVDAILDREVGMPINEGEVLENIGRLIAFPRSKVFPR